MFSSESVFLFVC